MSASVSGKWIFVLMVGRSLSITFSLTKQPTIRPANSNNNKAQKQRIIAWMLNWDDKNTAHIPLRMEKNFNEETWTICCYVSSELNSLNIRPLATACIRNAVHSCAFNLFVFTRRFHSVLFRPSVGYAVYVGIVVMLCHAMRPCRPATQWTEPRNRMQFQYMCAARCLCQCVNNLFIVDNNKRSRRKQCNRYWQ